MQATILIVDDCYSVREVIAAMLRKVGHRVICTGSRRRAITIIDQVSPDVMLLDVALSDGSGIAMLHELREDCGKDFPVIVFTGSGDVQSLLTGLGVTECLVKSKATNSQIRAAIETALQHRPIGNPYATAC